MFERKCTTCKVTYNRKTDFWKRSERPDKLDLQCKYCANKKRQLYRQTGRTHKPFSPVRRKIQQRNKQLKRDYGITYHEYALLLFKQAFKCAICKQPETCRAKKLSVDHCHKTGKVRKLLCFKCNTALGYIHENLDILDSMRQYIEEHNEHE